MTNRRYMNLHVGSVMIMLLSPMLMFLMGRLANKKTAMLVALEPELKRATTDMAQAVGEQQSGLELRTLDAERLRYTLASLARSKVEAYAANISMQEEQRLLQKQQEILTTSLLLDADMGRVSLMRDSQAARGFPVGYALPKAFGGITGKAVSGRIVSKERFAHPQRSRFEEKGKNIQWEPQQESQSLRSSALGEFVLFSQGNLILHGPSKMKATHDAYPHFCLGLSLETARSLYNAAFIGTRITVPPGPKASKLPPPGLLSDTTGSGSPPEGSAPPVQSR